MSVFDHIQVVKLGQLCETITLLAIVVIIVYSPFLICHFLRVDAVFVLTGQLARQQFQQETPILVFHSKLDGKNSRILSLLRKREPGEW